MKTILCHASDRRFDVLIPKPPENAICFSEGKFISFFGQYLYLFDARIISDNFRHERRRTKGLESTSKIRNQKFQEEEIIFCSQSLEWEWRVFDPISVDRYSLGVIEHWNHMKGTLGRYSMGEALSKIAIDLTLYPDGLNGSIKWP